MANPFYMGKSSAFNGINMNQVKQIYNMLRYSNNPTQLLNQIATQNPQLLQAINLVKSNGNYEQVFRNMCEERGINADDFIRQINS